MDYHRKYGKYGMPTLRVCRETVGGGILKEDDGRGEDKPGDTEGESPVTRLLDRSGDGVTDGP